MATVTDTAANMNLAGQLMSRPHHYCADHVLELTAKLLSDLKGVHDILKNCRAIIGSIHQSSQVAEHIEKLFDDPRVRADIAAPDEDEEDGHGPA